MNRIRFLFVLTVGILMTVLLLGVSSSKAETQRFIAQIDPTATVDAGAATSTPTASPTLPLTPAGPSARVDVFLNVRMGPGINFDKIGLLAPETIVDIVGRNADASWWQIVMPNSPDTVGWISAAYGIAENTDRVRLVAIPPTPTPGLPTATATASRVAPSPAETSRYPAIPPGKGLLYVLNFHGEDAQFSFFGQAEPYVIPGKRVVPEGAWLELFLEPGHYRWFSVVPAANLNGEGEFDLATGQIQGLGLAHGKIGPEDVVAGLLTGPDPLVPTPTPGPPPTPTATPVPPTPPPGQAVLVLDSGGNTGDILFLDQKVQIESDVQRTLILAPGFYDMNFAMTNLTGGKVCGPTLGSFNGYPTFGCHTVTHGNRNFQIDLPPDHICRMFIGSPAREPEFFCYKP